MNLVDKALWYIESHFGGEITLQEIAASGGVSRFHMSRAFGNAFGQPVNRYVRGRRLSEAARSLADGAPDILSVALDAGYSSHEAFTRAFRDQFAVTPEQVRARRSIDTLALVEPIMLDSSQLATLDPPRFETGRPLLLAGFSQRFDDNSSAAIPALWQRFNQHFGYVPGQIGNVGYGVCYNGDEAGNFDYMAGVEVSDFSGLPDEFARLRISEQTYAVFHHKDHIAGIRRTMNTIFSTWLPNSGRQMADAAVFERYDEAFEPDTGLGGFEIWIPVKG